MRAAVTALLAAAVLAACGTSATDGHGVGSAPEVTRTAPATPSSSPSTSVRASAPAPQPSSPDASQPRRPVEPPPDFVGIWYAHSRNLVVMRDGTVTLDFRIYIDCTATRTTECDRTRGNRIYDGGQVVAEVTHVINRTTLIMWVSATSAPDFVPQGPVRVGLDVTHDALAIFSGRLSGDPFCGPRSPAGYCGA